MTRVAHILTVGGTLMLLVVSASNFHGRQLPTQPPRHPPKAPRRRRLPHARPIRRLSSLMIAYQP